MTIHIPRRLFLYFTATLLVVFSGAVLSADEAEDAYQRGLTALGQGELDQAAAAFGEAVKLKPDEAKFYGMRATAWLRKGDYQQGMADMKDAIRLNPNDLGEKYQPTSNKELSATALEHGLKQVEKMLKDRPAMAQYGDEIEFLRSWAARKFAGEDLGSLIDWDSTPPVHSDAEHIAPEGKLHGAIRIEPEYTEGPKQGQARSFEELWAGAVFELHNINNAKEFVRLRKEAEQGKISKEDYVASIVKYEMLAAQQTRAYYVQVLLPFAAKKKLPTEPGLWFSSWWVQPDEALKVFYRQNGLSLAALRPRSRLGHGGRLLAATAVRKGDRASQSDVRGIGRHAGPRRGPPLAGPLPDTIGAVSRGGERVDRLDPYRSNGPGGLS